jgi:hypothetical protein
MKFVVHDLHNTLYQEVTTGASVVQVAAVRPHIYRKRWPAGRAFVQIQKTDGTVIAESDDVNFSTMGASTYWHGYVDFNVSAQLRPNTTYRIVLNSSGFYAFSSSAYIGWVNGLDLGKYPANYDLSDDGFDAPLDLEIWSRDQARRGSA